eukprot:42944-Eustigmatos_ZCMA.PRE.1
MGVQLSTYPRTQAPTKQRTGLRRPAYGKERLLYAIFFKEGYTSERDRVRATRRLLWSTPDSDSPAC